MQRQNGGKRPPFARHVADSSLDLRAICHELIRAAAQLEARTMLLQQDAEAHKGIVGGRCTVFCRQYPRTDPSHRELLQIVRNQPPAA